MLKWVLQFGKKLQDLSILVSEHYNCMLLLPLCDIWCETCMCEFINGNEVEYRLHQEIKSLHLWSKRSPTFFQNWDIDVQYWSVDTQGVEQTCTEFAWSFVDQYLRRKLYFWEQYVWWLELVIESRLYP